MASPCLSGGRTYGFDLEIVKSPCTSSTRTSHSSSPSSTLSESSNSPLAISTRKPRTPRKRPNQTYNEAAALLSTAYPNIFSNPSCKFSTKSHHHHPVLFDDSSHLLLPFRVFDNSGFLLHQPIREKPRSSNIANFNNFNSVDKSCSSPSSGEVCFQGDYCMDESQESFDAESMLDEEIEEGIDSIMGNLSVGDEITDSCWNPMGGGRFPLGFGIGMVRGVRAMRRVDDGNWWNFPIVDVTQISPRLSDNKGSLSNSNWNSNSTSNSNSKSKLKPKPNSSVKKKKKVAEKAGGVELNLELGKETENSGLLLRLNYDDVLNAWSDRGSPFSDEIPGPEGSDVSARLAQIDLFSESGVRLASVLRYKEKRRMRLFSKKIRYQVRKVNADQRPRMKGRFVRRPKSISSSEDDEKNKRSFKF